MLLSGDPLLPLTGEPLKLGTLERSGGSSNMVV
jgi:hypothetical protein